MQDLQLVVAEEGMREKRVKQKSSTTLEVRTVETLMLGTHIGKSTIGSFSTTKKVSM